MLNNLCPLLFLLEAAYTINIKRYYHMQSLSTWGEVWSLTSLFRMSILSTAHCIRSLSFMRATISRTSSPREYLSWRCHRVQQ